MVEVVRVAVPGPETDRSAYFGGGLSYGHRKISRGSYLYTTSSYSTSWSGSGLQGELSAGYELGRATSLRVFVQAERCSPFTGHIGNTLDEGGHQNR